MPNCNYKEDKMVKPSIQEEYLKLLSIKYKGISTVAINNYKDGCNPYQYDRWLWDLPLCFPESPSCKVR